jgi:hypothetical protein
MQLVIDSSRAFRSPKELTDLIRAILIASPNDEASWIEWKNGRLYGLVIRLNDRLPAGQVRWLHHVTEVGEYGLALEDMAAMLTRAQIAITDQERDDVLSLARQMEIDNRVSDALRSCPHAD